ncbi:MAG: acyl-CoA dehydrogenase [Micromonosporaceae bacterium]|nr:acyl-CoA dehydrogenase [Micromonosporaceae bacterium]
MDLSLPLEFKHIQESVRQFVSRELAPFEQQIDAADELDPALMQELRRRAVELGVYGFNIPSELGGGGLGPLGEVVIGQETGRTSMPLAEAIGRIPYALTRCSPEQVDWLLKPILQAHKTACIALTESEAGSDLGGIRTRAVRDGDSWQLTGSKQFISNAETSDYILVLAVTDPTAPLRKRFTVFVVDRSTPGLVFTHRFRKMGWHGYHVSSFSLDDCQVGPERVLGPVGGGFDTIMASVNTTRLYIAARCVGAARYLQELATEHAKTRTTFGRRLADHQAIQFMLADMDVEIEAAQLLTLAAAARGEEGTRDFRITVSRAKLYATEMVGRVADTTLQIFGGAGYMSELPIERIYRDMRGYRIGEGSSEMQRLQIARHALARG